MRCNPFLGSFPAFNATKTNLETGSYTRCMCVWPQTDRPSSSALFFPTTNAKAQLSFQFTNQTRQRARMQTCYVLTCRLGTTEKLDLFSRAFQEEENPGHELLTSVSLPTDITRFFFSNSN